MFDQHPEWFKQSGLLVHVAPEEELSRKLAGVSGQIGMTYRSGGITGVGENFLDLLNMPFADESVDLLYCCHVLNMVQDDRAAMKEVYRVMSNKGVALLQVPAFHRGETSLEACSAEESLRLFHDPMMFRSYSDSDYVSRLRSVGFYVERLVASDLAQATIEKYQLKNEVLHACYKKPRIAQ